MYCDIFETDHAIRMWHSNVKQIGSKESRLQVFIDINVVSSGKGTGNTNQYTQHKRQVFLVRGLRDKRENHVTSGIGLVSRSRVNPVYNQEREN